MKDVDKLQVLGLTSRCRCPPARATRARRLLRCRSPSGCRHDFRVKMWGTSSVSDPVGAGFVESLARPGGNVTGFALYEFGMSAKWLEMLKRIAPNVTRVGVLRDAALTAGVPISLQFTRYRSELNRRMRVRDRARRHGIRRLLQQRPDHEPDPVHGTGSQSDYRTCCPAQASHSLLPALPRRRWRLGVLWS